VRADHTCRRPGLARNLRVRRRDPSPLASITAKGGQLIAKTRTHGVWVPAFAGTTRIDFRHSFTFSRHDAPEGYLKFSPQQNRGRRAIPRGTQGKPSARCTRSPACNKKAHGLVTTGPPGTPGLPCAMVLTGYAALSPATNSSCRRHQRIEGLGEPGRARKTSADLTPATGARTTRFCRPQHAPFVCTRRSLTKPKGPALRSPHVPDAAASTASHPA
jgi:hypothetical protein